MDEASSLGIDHVVRESASPIDHLGQCLIDVVQRAGMRFEDRKIQQVTARKRCHLTRFASREPARADKRNTPRHDLMGIYLDGFGYAARVDHEPASAHAGIGLEKLLDRSPEWKTVDRDIDAFVAGLPIYPFMHRHVMC